MRGAFYARPSTRLVERQVVDLFSPPPPPPFVRSSPSPLFPVAPRHVYRYDASLIFLNFDFRIMIKIDKFRKIWKEWRFKNFYYYSTNKEIDVCSGGRGKVC